MAYLYFDNPLQLLLLLMRVRGTLYPAAAGAQVVGMLGAMLNVHRTLGWAVSLFRGCIRHSFVAPVSAIFIRRLAPTTLR